MVFCTEAGMNEDIIGIVGKSDIENLNLKSTNMSFIFYTTVNYNMNLCSMNFNI